MFYSMTVYRLRMLANERTLSKMIFVLPCKIRSVMYQIR